MKLVIFKETKIRLPAKRLRKLFELITEEEGDPEWQSLVNVVFITDSKIRRLNREYLGRDQTTDVMSFNLDSPGEKEGVFGEIYISAGTALRQASRYGGALSEELLHLFCHGLLHLFGYDHVGKRQASLMEPREQYYLNRLEESAK